MNLKMNELMCMFYIIFMLTMFNYIILNNLIFLSLLILIFKFSWLNWNSIWLVFSFNFYSIGLIMMMLWIFTIIIMNLNKSENIQLCMFLNMMLMMSMYFVFYSMNMIFFYFSFESSLLLIFYMIMKWGHGEFRFSSSFYLMFYTMIFSLPLVYLLFNMINSFNTMNFYLLEMMDIKEINNFKFIYLIFSFLVKIPMYMVHGWLLKAHVEASFFSSMILASVMLKLGSYGLMRMMFFMKYMFNKFRNYFIMINMFGILLLSMMCLYQMDIKLIIAISSIVHMGIMIMGMLLMTKMSMYGSFYMMISHGFISSGLFYFVNLIYNQTNSRLLYINKGMISVIPSSMMFWSIMCFCNSGSPFSMNLISEIILLISLICWFKYMMLFVMTYSLVSFIYSVYLFMSTFHGKNFMKFKMFNCKLMNYLSLINHIIPVNLMFLNLI
uniref:NADH dehydrogenase subunit 4 n=1 Tax=Tetragonula iridipennis TaxID=597212 RepID=UPI0026E2CD99|nr:NADH dehydrogenase subunit 4 [Tetragonula iridipennis]WJQ22762.1 NADH dehydrogenase subunit 4 [Tetragonula iridipennis]